MWLGDGDAALTLAYDLVQLGGLLYLTGGLHNPFSVFILAPATISATLLSRRSTFWVTALTVVIISFLAVLHEPLPWPDPTFRMEPIYVFAAWFALVLAAIFLAAYIWSVAEEARRMSDALAATQMALDREHRVAALGALAAAAAHELGTPLGTIAVAAKELTREAPPASPLAEDAALILSQSLRCRDILTRLAGRPEVAGPESSFLQQPLSVIVATAAEPHRAAAANIALQIQTMANRATSRGWRIGRHCCTAWESHSERAAIRVARGECRNRLGVREVAVTIRDDGPGFSPEILDQLGDPYVSMRDQESEGKLHMGLGIFIANTLLARTGAKVHFDNTSEGARVTVCSGRQAHHWREPSGRRAGMQDVTDTPTLGPSPFASGRPATRRLLILVDDDAPLRRSLQRALERRGFRSTRPRA